MEPPLLQAVTATERATAVTPRVCPDRVTSGAVTPRRANTPLHTLTTLNDTQYVEAACVWAEELPSFPDDATRSGYAFRATTGGVPGAKNLATLERTLARTRKRFAVDPGAATKLLAVGAAKRTGALETDGHTVWATVAMPILNRDETMTQ